MRKSKKIAGHKSLSDYGRKGWGSWQVASHESFSAVNFSGWNFPGSRKRMSPPMPDKGLKHFNRQLPRVEISSEIKTPNQRHISSERSHKSSICEFSAFYPTRVFNRKWKQRQTGEWEVKRSRFQGSFSFFSSTILWWFRFHLSGFLCWIGRIFSEREKTLGFFHAFWLTLQLGNKLKQQKTVLNAFFL